MKKKSAAHSLSRRSFLGSMGAAAVALSAAGLPQLASTAQATKAAPELSSGDRRSLARQIRMDAAQLAFERPFLEHQANGEEQDYPWVANFSKGLPHNNLGEVDPAAYQALLAALASGDPAMFEAIPLGGSRKLRNPKSGLAFDLQGPDSHHLAIRPAPRIDSPENSAEMAELYWMALARDVPFTEYETDPLIGAAAADLSNFSDFRGPKQGGRVTPSTIFRGITSGDLVGPYLSQFLLRPIPYGSLTISQQQQTVLPGINYLTDYASWLHVQNGGLPSERDQFDPVPRYIRNFRDLGQYVHVDALYEAYLNACLIL